MQRYLGDGGPEPAAGGAMVSGTVEINSATPDQRQVHPVLPRDLLDVGHTAARAHAGGCHSQPARVPEATTTCKIQRFKLWP